MIESIIAGKPFRMELDTGTAISIISEKDFKVNFRNIALDIDIDYCVTFNPVLKVDQYPMPKVYILANLSGGKKFTKLDRTQAKEKYRGVFEIQKSGDKTSSGEIGLDIRTHASPKVGQDQVSGGVSVLCWHITKWN